MKTNNQASWRKPLVIILMVIAVLHYSYILNAQWSQTNGPEGGDISDVLLDGADLYASTSSGGVYKSGDAGANWSLVGDDIVGDEGRTIIKSGVNILVATDRGISYQQMMVQAGRFQIPVFQILMLNV